MPVNNHTVLLKGVNDDLETMRKLMRALLRIKVRPVLPVPLRPGHRGRPLPHLGLEGMEIMEGLRGHMSGLGIPTYVVDSPHGGGKIPLMPNYLVSASDDAVCCGTTKGCWSATRRRTSRNTSQPTANRGVS